MSASFLAAAAVRAADARDATEPEVSLSSLPMEIISDILRRTASTRSLALASRVSKAMHAFAAAAALDRASELGYAANFQQNHRFDQNHRFASRSIAWLYLQYNCPRIARLPKYGIPVEKDGRHALHKVRTDFAHFRPCLCRQLGVMPADASDQATRRTDGEFHHCPTGSVEYANLAAIFCSSERCGRVSALPPEFAPPSTDLIQMWIERGWAEGFDRRGHAHFDGQLVGKRGRPSCIGTSDMAVALWHLRFRAYIVDFDHCSQPGARIHALACRAFKVQLPPHNGYYKFYASSLDARVCMPMVLQWEGDSALIVGATTAIDPKLLVCDPYKPGVIMPIALDAFQKSYYQVVLLLGTGPSDDTLTLTMEEYLEEMGQEACLDSEQSDSMTPLAVCTEDGWELNYEDWDLGDALFEDLIRHAVPPKDSGAE